KEELSATKDELTGRLLSVEEAKAGVESSLEAVTAERYALVDKLDTLRNDYDFSVVSLQKTIDELQDSERDLRGELSELRREKESLSENLRIMTLNFEATGVRLHRLRDICGSAGGMRSLADGNADYPVTREVLKVKKK
ncbi:kinesin-like protein, partial [Trypanosoma grayi]|uniref:kinesin-like protein n=1 Tax=Trypanosoma grayi TaxID=71804 RepID=UPI0004F4639D